jgi:hypothetical protein
VSNTPDWKVFGLADFNGDGKTDILFQRDDGSLQVWMMDGITRITIAPLRPSADTNLLWNVVGTGDFNGDGKPDIVFHHETLGYVRIWLMDGITRITSSYITPNGLVNTAWVPRAIGDYNDDGKPDIVWLNNTSGLMAAWYMDGFNRIGAASFVPNGVANTSWKVVAPR